MRRLIAAAAIIAAVGGTATAVSAGPGNSGGGSGRPLSTVLTPGAEVAPFVGVEGASGEISLRLNPGRQQVCVDLTTDGIDLALAHIHEGAAGTNGGVVVDFSGLIDGDNASGCVQADRSVIIEIIQDPADYYINAHDPSFNRAIRGQLGR